MKRIYLKDLETHLNHEITLQGFVDNIRDLQYVQFIILRDITEKVQITIEKNEENKKLNEIVSNLTNESTIKVVGRLLANSKVKLRGMELLPSEIIVTSKSLEELPFNFKNND